MYRHNGLTTKPNVPPPPTYISPRTPLPAPAVPSPPRPGIVSGDCASVLSPPIYCAQSSCAMCYLVLRSDHPSCVPLVLLTAHHPPTTYYPRPHPTDMTSHHRDRRTRARRPVADVYSLAGHRTTHHHRSIVVGAVAGLVHSGRLVVLAIYLSAALSAFSCTLLMPCIHARLSISRSVQYLCRVDRHARRWQL
ncbi:hypothetical protein K523DRAFT_58010 [Schizophyllum commune Tattone D]|nr:hypothetical protein K523DRAFT_58010 [Schizophyllum commune Tattone D]